MNVQSFSGSNPFVVFAKASIIMNSKIETMCVKTNVRVVFTPPQVMNGDCVKILYYHHENFTMCQRVVELRLNERNKDSSKQFEPDFSEVSIQKIGSKLTSDYDVIYGYDYSHCIYEVEINAGLSVLEKFEKFFDKIPYDSCIAFVDQRTAIFVPLFVKALLRQLRRNSPIHAYDDPNWLSNNVFQRDLIACTLNNMKTEFIIILSSQLLSKKPIFTRNATKQYSSICLPKPSKEEENAMIFLSSENNKQSDEAYPMHRNNFEKYLRKTK